MSNPSTILAVALIGCTPNSLNCDPAIDVNASGVAAKLTTYERSRSVADRDALPLHKDARLTLFQVAPLSPAGVRVVLNEQGARRAQYAVQVACHEFTDASGQVHRAADHGGLQTSGKLAIASDEWLDHIAELFGHKAINELASVILIRAEAGPLALAPFVLPLGLMLAR